MMVRVSAVFAIDIIPGMDYNRGIRETEPWKLNILRILESNSINTPLIGSWIETYSQSSPPHSSIKYKYSLDRELDWNNHA